MTEGPGSALARCVGDVDAFATEYWGARPMHRRPSGSFEDLLDVATVERLLLDLGRQPTFRLVRDGVKLATSEYTQRTRVGGVTIADVADVDRIVDHVAHGATVVMQGLQRFWPPLAEFCLDLERAISHPVQANAYLTPPGAGGLAEHSDEHEVIVLHVAGTKRWDVHGLGTVELEPGDVIYVPSGVRHVAHTTEVFSLHVTLGLLTTTYRQVLRRALDRLPDDALDRPLPLGFATGDDPDSLVAGASSAIASAAEMFGQLDPVVLAEAEVRRRRRRARRRPTGRLAIALQPTAIAAESYVRRCRDDPMQVIDDTSSVVLTSGGHRLRVPPIAADALRLIATRDWFRIDELPGLDADDRLVLVRRLIREGVLEPA